MPTTSGCTYQERCRACSKARCGLSALSPVLNRWLNLVFGVAYTAIILITMWGWRFLVFYGVIEISLTSLVVWYAWKWPKAQAGG